MYLMYVDESGDPGLKGSPTRYFILTGLVIHELHWRKVLDALIAFRQKMRSSFGLKLREEIHAAKLITSPGALVRIKRHDRLVILRAFSDHLADLPYINIINVVVDKNDKNAGYEVFEMAWKVLIQRFENTLKHGNFKYQSNPDDQGLLFPDATSNKRLQMLLRSMRNYNPIPNRIGAGYRNMSLTRIIDDPNFRNSSHSYFIQAADLAAYLLYQHLNPNSYMKKKGGHNYFDRLTPILCRAASSNDPKGIVRL
jgi:hypothetical protein